MRIFNWENVISRLMLRYARIFAMRMYFPLINDLSQAMYHVSWRNPIQGSLIISHRPPTCRPWPKARANDLALIKFIREFQLTRCSKAWQFNCKIYKKTHRLVSVNITDPVPFIFINTYRICKVLEREKAPWKFSWKNTLQRISFAINIYTTRETIKLKRT